MMLEELINYAAEKLPEGWEIQLHVENGSGWVELINPSWESIDLEKADCSLTEQMENSIKKAIELEVEYQERLKREVQDYKLIAEREASKGLPR